MFARSASGPVLHSLLKRQFFNHQLSSRCTNRPQDNQSEYRKSLDILNKYKAQHGWKVVRTSPKDTPKDRTRSWLGLLGYDIESNRVPSVIHVAGTKGKGTTCLYVNQILVEHQKILGTPQKIGCLTSPHQVDVRERILINNSKISKSLFSHYVQELDRQICLHSTRHNAPPRPKYPGFLTLLATYLFIKEKFDLIIIETGIGGETDSTNIFPNPIATGITSIGFDHVSILGNTLEKIAWHKSGIFKRGSPAFTVPQDPAVMHVLEARAREKSVSSFQVVEELTTERVKVEPNMTYQRNNASLAISLAEEYLKSRYPSSSVIDFAHNLHKIELLGKAQVLQDGGYTWLISSGHNEMSLKETTEWLKGISGRSKPLAMIFSTPFSRSSPRDAHALLRTVHEGLVGNDALALKTIVFCIDDIDCEQGFDNYDNLLQNQVANAGFWKELGGSGHVHVVHTPRDAIQLIKHIYQQAEILVAGSSYLSGNVLHILGKE